MSSTVPLQKRGSETYSRRPDEARVERPRLPETPPIKPAGINKNRVWVTEPRPGGGSVLRVRMLIPALFNRSQGQRFAFATGKRVPPAQPSLFEPFSQAFRTTAVTTAHSRHLQRKFSGVATRKVELISEVLFSADVLADYKFRRRRFMGSMSAPKGLGPTRNPLEPGAFLQRVQRMALIEGLSLSGMRWLVPAKWSF